MKLERELEKEVTNYARKVGILSFKFTSPGRRGVPDRILIGPGGTVFLELKREGEKPTKLQRHYIDAINDSGGTALWADNFGACKDIIDGLRREKL